MSRAHLLVLALLATTACGRAWSDAHQPRTFPLTDSHAVACAACHVDPATALDPACASCHEAVRPSGHFEDMDCGGCHRPTTWGDASFDHDALFPLPHRGVGDCASCHLDYPSTATFSCTHCHEHRQSEADDEHDDVSGYRWESEACLSCHPRGDDR